ncbi:MAG: DUF1828 domain-containing protein [Dehalococcoidia bacterium]
MTQLCETILRGAEEQFREGFAVRDLGGGACLLVTPYLRHDNDAITLRVLDEGGGRYVVTDGGQSLDYLRMSGFTTRRNPPFQRFLRELPTTFGVDVDREELVAECDEDELSVSIQSVARAALHVSYMVLRRRERVVTSFADRVEVALIEIGAQYESDYEVQGLTKPAHFAFFVNGDRNALVQPLSATSRGAAENKADRFLFKVFDVKERSPDFRFIAVVDDFGAAADLWSTEQLNSLATYSDGLVRWSRNHTEELSETLERR